MPSSALQARDPRVRKERCGTGKRWEMRKLWAVARLAPNLQVTTRERRRLSRSAIQGMGSTELKCAALLVSNDVRSHAALHKDQTGEGEERE